eukprot:4346524-Amphidinium_carterae.1
MRPLWFSARVCHMKVKTERVRMLYDHIERDFPRFESTGDLLAMTLVPDLAALLVARLDNQSTSDMLLDDSH